MSRLASVFLTPLLICFGVSVIWIFLIGGFRGAFDFPWGDDKSPIDPTFLELLIYNGVQLIFVVLLFAVSAYIYRRALQILSSSNVDCKKMNASASLSWFIYCLNSFVLASFFCCPGLFPEVFNHWYWLTQPEFIAFTLLGVIYIWRTSE